MEQAEKLRKSGKAAEAQALLRGWMTVVIELMGHADDSCGSIGMSFGEGFAAYLKIPLGQDRDRRGRLLPGPARLPDLGGLRADRRPDRGLLQGTDPGPGRPLHRAPPAADRRVAGRRPGVPERGGAHAAGPGRRRAGAVRRVRGPRQGDGVTGMAADHPPGRPGGEAAEEAPGDARCSRRH